MGYLLDDFYNIGAVVPSHSYLLHVQGLPVKDKEYRTRVEAEIAMHKICAKYNILGVECSEHDKHQRKYSNHQGVRFYINRI